MATEGDDQYTAEATDGEVLSDDSDNAEGALEYPPDRFQGVNQYGTTAGEERVDEPLAQHLARHVPDPFDEIDEPTPEELRELEREALGGPDSTDEEVDDVYTDEGFDVESDESIGRLVEPGAEDDGVYAEDEEADLVARSVGEEKDLTAEEAAVHLTGEPPMGDLGGGYER